MSEASNNSKKNDDLQVVASEQDNQSPVKQEQPKGILSA